MSGTTALTYDLIVMQAFPGHAQGERITDDATITAILAGPYRNRVNRVAALSTGGGSGPTLAGVPSSVAPGALLSGLTYVLPSGATGSVDFAQGGTSVAGSSVALSGASGAVPVLTAPATAGSYAVRLLDAGGAVLLSLAITVAAASSGGGTGSGTTFAPGVGLELVNGVLRAKVGTAAGTLAAGDDARFGVGVDAQARTDIAALQQSVVAAGAGVQSVALDSNNALVFTLAGGSTLPPLALPSASTITPRGTWAAGTAYNRGDVVTQAGNAYMAPAAIAAAGSFAAGSWMLLIAKPADGAPGVPGLPGKSTTAGPGIPSNTDGADGDTHGITHPTIGTGTVYRKIAGVWTLQPGETMRGPAGPATPGPQGEPGPPGAAGLDGPPGADGATPEQVAALVITEADPLAAALSDMRTSLPGTTPGTLIPRGVITAPFTFSPAMNGGVYSITGANVPIAPTLADLGGGDPAAANGFSAEYWNDSTGPLPFAGELNQNGNTYGMASLPAGQPITVSVSAGKLRARLSGGVAASGAARSVSVSPPSGVVAGAAYGTTGTLQAFTGADPAYTITIDGAAATGATLAYTGPANARTGFTVSGIPATTAGNHVIVVTVDGVPSTSVQFSVAVAAPGPVRNVLVGAQSASGFTASWDAPNTGGAVASIRVRYRVQGATTWLVAAASLAGNALIYTFTGLNSATTYEIEVATVNATGEAAVTTTGTTQAAAAGFTGALNAYEGGLATVHDVTRCLLNSYTGPLIRVRHGGTGTETDIPYVTSTGLLNTTALASAANGGDLFIAKVYGQRQGVAASQSVATRQTRIVQAGVLKALGSNNRPAMEFINANKTNLQAPGVAFSGTDLHALVVARTNATAGTIAAIAGGGGTVSGFDAAGPHLFFTDTTGTRIRSHRKNAAGTNIGLTNLTTNGTAYVARTSWRGAAGGTAQTWANETASAVSAQSNLAYEGSMSATGNTLMWGCNRTASDNQYATATDTFNDLSATLITANALTAAEAAAIGAEMRTFFGI